VTGAALRIRLNAAPWRSPSMARCPPPASVARPRRGSARSREARPLRRAIHRAHLRDDRGTRARTEDLGRSGRLCRPAPEEPGIPRHPARLRRTHDRRRMPGTAGMVTMNSPIGGRNGSSHGPREQCAYAREFFLGSQDRVRNAVRAAGPYGAHTGSGKPSAPTSMRVMCQRPRLVVNISSPRNAMFVGCAIKVATRSRISGRRLSPFGSVR